MGKRDKKQQRQQRRGSRRGGGFSYCQEEEEGVYEADYSHHSSLPSSSDRGEAEEEADPEEDFDKEDNDGDKNDTNPSTDTPSKFLLYQQSVQVLTILIPINFNCSIISCFNGYRNRNISTCL